MLLNVSNMRFVTSGLTLLVLACQPFRSANAATPPGAPAGAEVSAPAGSTAPAPSPWMVSGIAMVTPLNNKPEVTDNHSLGGASVAGGFRLDGRYRPVPWLGLALGVDYLQDVGAGPARHLSAPLRLYFLPLRTSGFELGAGLGAGPSFAWYEAQIGTDSPSLHAKGMVFEVRIEGAVALNDELSLLISTGARAYGESFTNAIPGSYASGGFESPAAAVDVGIGLGWRL